MFRVDRSQNRISRLSQRKFSELALRERDHLQEWLANQPDALGEELLIIQKEFDGFNETSERLDLLALDKDGNLVIIENKLDDSGKNVTWQALKYTAYVSTLSKEQIAEIYQRYLDRYENGANASERLCEFLGVEDLSEVTLNRDSDQRIILIAASFRREVTATALWLISRGINVKCFKATPWILEEELFVDIQQIIPPPEASDFMISMANKEIAAKAANSAQQHRNNLRAEFWELTFNQLKHDGITLFRNSAVSNQHWRQAKSGIRFCVYEMLFNTKEIKIQFIFDHSNPDINNEFFDLIHEEKLEIEAQFGDELEWRRMPKRRCIIAYSRAIDQTNKNSWPEIAEWLSIHVKRLEEALSERLIRLSERLSPPAKEDI